jgi:P2-related tail formation protein
MVMDDSWSLDRRRALVAKAFDFYRLRGTAAGLKSQIEALTGGSVELHETGGVSTSATAASAFPGSPNFAVLVRVEVDDPAAINVNRLDALVKAAKPAHVTHKLELVKRAQVKDPVEVTSS